jgi:hypothetical protein
VSARLVAANGAPTRRLPVVVQLRSSPSGAWRTWKSVLTDGSGRVRVTNGFSAPTWVRFVYAGAAVLAPTTSPASTLTLRTKLNAKASRSGIVAATLTRQGGGGVAGARLVLLVKRGPSSWRPLTTRTTTSSGTAVVRLHALRRASVRWVFPGRAGWLATASNDLRLR